MVRLLSVAFLGCAVLAVAANAQTEGTDASGVASGSNGGSELVNPDLPALPPVPKGTTTIVGGAIRNLDPVRDQFSLDIYGQRPMKMLFDERTQVYRDGVKIPLRDLRPEEHASVQTILDGSNVFAVSIHILSQSPEGECQGRVLRYNPGSGELDVSAPPALEPVRLYVPTSATVVRKGQNSFTAHATGRNDLMDGTLIEVTFHGGQNSRGTVDQITILAVPGSSFQFAGAISYLDMSIGFLNLVDPRDGKSYEIHFTPARMPASGNLHVGESVTVTAYYNGSQYRASQITAR